MSECPNCRQEVEAGYMFCPDCGHDLDRGEDDGATGIEDGAWGATETEYGTGETTGGTLGGSADGAATTAADASTGTGDGSDEVVPTADAGTGGDAAHSTDVDGDSPFRRGSVTFAAEYPVRDGWNPVLFGALVEFAGLIVPFVGLIVRGYGLRLCRAAARGQTDPPAFDDLGAMFVDGLRILAVGIVYVFAFVLFAGVFGTLAGFVHEALTWAVFLLAGLAAWYAFPASLTAVAAHESFGAAFSSEYAGAFLATGTYLKAWLLFLVLGVATSILTLVSLLTIVGVFVVAAWTHYLYGAFWGYYYREAVAAGEVPPAPTEPA